MWRLYTVADQGVAIQSTVQKLSDSLELSSFKTVLTGVVDYHRSEQPPSGVAGKVHIVDYFNKRESFSYENEYRILVMVDDFTQANKLGGISIPVDLKKMIEKVYVSPRSPNWIVELIRALVEETYSLDVSVIQSDLYSEPFS